MRGKRQNWIPNPCFETIPRLFLLGAWNIWMNGNPSAREDRDKATPYNVPYSTAMGDIGARI